MGAPAPSPTSLQKIIMIIMICFVSQGVGGQAPSRTTTIENRMEDSKFTFSMLLLGDRPPFLKSRKTIRISRHREPQRHQKRLEFQQTVEFYVEQEPCPSTLATRSVHNVCCVGVVRGFVWVGFAR